MTVEEFLRAKGMNMHQLSQAVKISYATLHAHVRHGHKLGEASARKLEKWSRGEMNAAQILGLRPPPERAP
jgi:hypothetical protein